MRRLFAPADPGVALRLVAGLFGLMGTFFVLWALLKLRDFDLDPGRIIVFAFGIANGVASMLLFRDSEWGRRLGIFLMGVWALIGGVGLVIGVGFSLFWNHSVPPGPVIAILSLTLAYVWMLIILLRADVGCILG